METWKICMIQYQCKDGNEILNRFYGQKDHLSHDTLRMLINDAIDGENNNSLVEVANRVEREILDKNGFIKITGIKTILQPRKYKEIIWPIGTYPVRVPISSKQ